MQALGIAWDTRPKAQGGQRWFQLEAQEHIRAGDELHWMGPQNNFNFMCAECHVTQFKKNFNPDTRTFASTWAEMAVGCEACHGPGSGHVAWAGTPSNDPLKGLALSLHDRKGVQWYIDPQTGNAQRSPALPGFDGGKSQASQEVEMCARCHAHRSQFSDNYVHGKPLQDTHAPSLLMPGLFWSDGQMRGEVYNYASFLQSKMAQKGVTCSDCHDPHSGKPRAPGNATCAQCHATTKYDAPNHHFHANGSAGAQCANCHMPTTTYMTVDPRHDHYIRVPRPDLSAQRGTPNACNQCHRKESTAWAARWAQTWYPQLAQRAAVSASAITRASALALMTGPWNVTEMDVLQAALTDTNGLVRNAAVDALANGSLAQREAFLRPLLADSFAAVRMSAARALADANPQDWAAEDRNRWNDVLQEYMAALRFNADRMEADLNLADLYRQMGRDPEALELLQQAVTRTPGNATAWHALGLALHRQRHPQEAVVALQKAAQLAPDNRHFAYVAQLAAKK
jgi:hypothetical protein